VPHVRDSFIVANVGSIPPKAGGKPEGRSDRLMPLLLPLNFIFRVFSPKIACQAPEPPKHHKPKKIELAG
jgi:hypothetical protein